MKFWRIQWTPTTAILIFFLIRSIFSCSEAPRKFPARANAEGMTQWDPFEHSLSQEAGPKKKLHRDFVDMGKTCNLPPPYSHPVSNLYVAIKKRKGNRSESTQQISWLIHMSKGTYRTHAAKRALSWKINTFAAFSRSNKVFTSCLCM